MPPPPPGGRDPRALSSRSTMGSNPPGRAEVRWWSEAWRWSSPPTAVVVLPPSSPGGGGERGERGEEREGREGEERGRRGRRKRSYFSHILRFISPLVTFTFYRLLLFFRQADADEPRRRLPALFPTTYIPRPLEAEPLKKVPTGSTPPRTMEPCSLHARLHARAHECARLHAVCVCVCVCACVCACACVTGASCACLMVDAQPH